jgi:hypothetical protein
MKIGDIVWNTKNRVLQKIISFITSKKVKVMTYENYSDTLEYVKNLEFPTSDELFYKKQEWDDSSNDDVN